MTIITRRFGASTTRSVKGFFAYFVATALLAMAGVISGIPLESVTWQDLAKAGVVGLILGLEKYANWEKQNPL